MKSAHNLIRLVLLSPLCLVLGYALAQPGPQEFVRASGPNLVLGSETFLLKAICFANSYEGISDPNDLLQSSHHTEDDFRTVAELGFNAVRFAFTGDWFERDPDAFFRWLDQNLAWARGLGIYLILDLHIPIGGYWLSANSDRRDFRLWTDAGIRRKNVDLWKALAARYKNETQIAAYDILNEPVTADSTGQQWQDLANDIIAAIRSEDPSHLIVVQRLYGVSRSYSTHGAQTQFLVNDGNVVYDFHFYEPVDYTHQFASWLERPTGDGGKYPDNNTFLPTGAQQLIVTAAQETPVPFTPADDWQEYRSAKFKVTDPEIVMGLPVMIVGGESPDTVYFDDFAVREFNAAGEYIGDVVEDPLSQESIWSWWTWNNPPERRHADFTRVVNFGRTDDHSLAIAQPAGPGFSGWSSDHRWFPVKQGHAYQIVGYMKRAAADAEASSDGLSAYFDIGFYGNPSNGSEAGFVARNKEYLRQEFLKYYQFSETHDVPMSVLEFGLMKQCFDSGKGGTRWVSDSLDIFKQHNVSFAYWNYHGDRMGLYLSPANTEVGLPNQPLIDVLRDRLGAW